MVLFEAAFNILKSLLLYVDKPLAFGTLLLVVTLILVFKQGHGQECAQAAQPCQVSSQYCDDGLDN